MISMEHCKVEVGRLAGLRHFAEGLPVHADDALEFFDDLRHCGAVLGLLRPHTLDKVDDFRAPLLAESRD